MAKRASDGWRMHKAPYGLRKARDAAGRAIVIEDGEVAELVRYLLVESAKGIYSIRQMVERANKLGLTTTTGREMS